MDLQCACGAVHLKIDGEPLASVYCHCDDCQHAHGAAYVPRAIVRRGAVSVASGNTRSWMHGVRSMTICCSCGSYLYSERDGSPVKDVNAGLFPAGEFRPQAHIHCRFAIAVVADDLPHYRDLPEEFGGTGELVGW